jgi:integrase
LRCHAEKKGNPALIGLGRTLRAIVERRLAARRLGCDLIFHRRGRKMDPERDRELFAEACKELGLPYGREDGFTIYTVKSTAIGLAHDAGLSEGEIMDRSGHKSSMMRRYLKQHPERAHAASAKLEAHLAETRARLAESALAFPRKHANL